MFDSKEGGGRRERETSISCLLYAPQPGYNLAMYPGWESNPQRDNAPNNDLHSPREFLRKQHKNVYRSSSS